MMNQEQKEQLRALRQRGMSYKGISDVCHLAKSTVSTFCKKKTLTASVQTKLLQAVSANSAENP